MSPRLAVTFLAKLGNTNELGKLLPAAPALSRGSGRLCLPGKDYSVTQPPTSRRPGTAAGHVAGTRRAQTGGRVAGKTYAPEAPRLAGRGPHKWPALDYSHVEPRSLREAYIWWQQICQDVAPRRRERGWEQQQLADEIGISVNTLQRIERGDWVAAHNLFQVCSALDLEIGQVVGIHDPGRPAQRGPAPRAGDQEPGPAVRDRIATRADVIAGRSVITTLARHHHLLEPRVDEKGVVYVRSGGQGFKRLWRFASLVALTLGVWVHVSDDEGAGNRAEATRL
jgi:DNA-binding Xre family transcriptional regulator